MEGDLSSLPFRPHSTRETRPPTPRRASLSRQGGAAVPPDHRPDGASAGRGEETPYRCRLRRDAGYESRSPAIRGSCPRARQWPPPGPLASGPNPCYKFGDAGKQVLACADSEVANSMLVVAALVTLFLNLELIVWGAKLRAFDALVLVMFLHLALTRGPDIRLPLGLVLCGLFFTVEAASAAMLGPGNLLREGIQVGSSSSLAPISTTA